ncbi:DUF2127 domain-containing protein [Vitiosangium sp. GDMCC 1.1324]|uniref:DUF2127 domain-containing protein n=1 Tax=Vitiosangium sp. (strain GDMCC 1.1324) TaxID=2138576 RepID=UPI000D33743A|nr:DUF2127 domain-containing protein [Vitiosangium sp. GDMCC 1.1324]PTL80764.1 DUF2127 domain-containing protein [Vitiosangium sp. GDMCC 1.1324]
MNEATPHGGRGLTRLIAVFKLVKAMALIAIGVGVLDVLGEGTTETVARWLAASGMSLSGPIAERIFHTLSLLDSRKLVEISAVSFTYAVLFLIEGVGLWFDRLWAEYFTLFITVSFIPFELYELVKRPSIAKAVGLGLNVAVAVYLAVRIARRRRSRASGGGGRQVPSYAH